jgi:transposase-like protein
MRRAIQDSEESVAKLADRYDINPKTVAKWRKRSYVEDAPMGPKEARSTVLTPEEEAMIVAFRRHTLLPLDDCLYALQATIPHLTRSSLRSNACIVRIIKSKQRKRCFAKQCLHCSHYKKQTAQALLCEAMLAAA